MMAVWKFAPALAAGCTVVLKPSDTTPASSYWMVEKMQEIFPPGVCNLVCGDRDTGAALVAHPVPQLVSITGSTRAGMAVAASAANDLKRAHLELGGKAPVVIFNDADIAAAVEGLTAAGYFNAAQDCTAATRLIIQDGIYDEFLSAMAESVAGTRTGYDPRMRTSCLVPSTTATRCATSMAWCPVRRRTLEFLPAASRKTARASSTSPR
ncbi:aldehyde dehydrogenase family protein [Mycobacterium ulcerans str. Harvey]|uniref:Putative succinate-semialdehyde dehydrogenase [NADP(+)] 2 n=1 Tax=Mycobacterium ulcerans str. Harvey TaxID=1299332 RepID=A0ABN0QUW3_MYCUL|nr:aldehyde dehydrogenase family protein [Mycobacterium ulcerans str. Harvey]